MSAQSRQGQDIISRVIPKDKKEVTTSSLSLFAYLLGELLQYSQARSPSHAELESRLLNAGYEVGSRAVELLGYRDGTRQKRVLRSLDIVRQVAGSLWPYLFGHVAENLEQDTKRDDTFYLHEPSVLYTKFMSEYSRDQASSEATKKDTPAYFVAGIVKGYLDNAGFPAEVDAVCNVVDHRHQTSIIICFAKSVMEREQRLQR